jgi:hypothetical protein
VVGDACTGNEDDGSATPRRAEKAESWPEGWIHPDASVEAMPRALLGLCAKEGNRSGSGAMRGTLRMLTAACLPLWAWWLRAAGYVYTLAVPPCAQRTVGAAWSVRQSNNTRRPGQTGDYLNDLFFF